MKLGGLQKLTLVDYPGKVAATVFTLGCNFRCQFCHNAGLLTWAKEKIQTITERDLFNFLDTRRGLLEGVCLTGGEPTLQPDLPVFIGKIKDRGFSVKLDTNGSNPEMLEDIIKSKLVDYVAMDIKSIPEKYGEITNTQVNVEKIKRSVELVKKLPDYEFRTTIANRLQGKEELLQIVSWLSGSKKYFLQQYQPADRSINPYAKPLAQFPEKDLAEVLAFAQDHFELCQARR